MGKGKINIFGTRFAYPKGLRKSPGTNWFASCVGAQMSGSHHSGRAATHQAFRSAAQSCRGKKNA